MSAGKLWFMKAYEILWSAPIVSFRTLLLFEFTLSSETLKYQYVIRRLSVVNVGVFFQSTHRNIYASHLTEKTGMLLSAQKRKSKAVTYPLVTACPCTHTYSEYVEPGVARSTGPGNGTVVGYLSLPTQLSLITIFPIGLSA